MVAAVTRNGFQGFVNNEPPIGVPGDFAGANIRSSTVAPPGGFVAPAEGCTVGAFAWGDPATGLAGNYYKPNSVFGFVHREMNALITTFEADASMEILPGEMVTLLNQGDFMVTMAGGATVGQKVYADPLTGVATANATGDAVGGAITAASIATTGIMTVATITGTPLAVGQVITGAGVSEGTYIASEGSGTGGTGTYNLANVNGTPFGTVTSEAMAYWGVQETPWYVQSNCKANASFTAAIAAPVAPSTQGIMTVSAVASGTLEAGQFLTATGLTVSNVQILSQLTSTASGGALGSTGTYAVNYVGSAAVTSTNTFAATQGQLCKISSWANSL